MASDYCERDYSIMCSECSLVNYGLDCRNNPVHELYGVSWQRLSFQVRYCRLTEPVLCALPWFHDELEKLIFEDVENLNRLSNRLYDYRSLHADIESALREGEMEGLV